MFEFTGERVIPDQVDRDLLNEHLARYAFAARLACGKRVLDAGCGTGYGSAELAEPARAVVGADIAAEAVAYAREHYRLHNLYFEQAACGALPHTDAAFDLVVAFEVIEHLRDWREFLLEARRVLAPDGQFVVSTPNKRYYAESRGRVGPNPFHAHEFEFDEFHAELSAVFPFVSLFLENHVEGVVFRPVEAVEAAEVRVDGGETAPAESHFFVAVCALHSRRESRWAGGSACPASPQTSDRTFVYIPSAANVLREREAHIALLEGELRQKNAWLESAKQELVKLDREHRNLIGELEERNRWAAKLNQELAAGGAEILKLQADLGAANEWAQHVDTALTAKVQELTQCVEYLHQAEKTVEERTRWAQGLDAEVAHLRGKLALLEASRWVRLGRSVGLGPDTDVSPNLK